MMNFENKKKLFTLGISCAIIFIILYLITNFTAISGFLSSVFSVIAPIVIGAAIAYILNPLLKLFEYKVFKKMKSKSARRSLSLLLTYIVAILIICAIVLLMIPQLIDSINNLKDNFNSYIDSAAEYINSLIDKFSSNPSKTEHFDGERLKELAVSFIVSSGDVFSSASELIKQFVMGLFISVKNAFIGFFISIYILISKENLHAHVRRIFAAIFKDKHRTRILRYVRIANRTFGNFFIGKIIDSIIIAILTFIVLLIFRIPYALLVSTFVGITNVIPVFGPFIGAIPSAFIIFIASPQKALLFLVLILIIQQIDGNIIGPKILGDSTGISSLGVIIAIVIMGEYFGIIGMIVGVPIFATIMIIANELIETKLKAKGEPHAVEDYYPAYSLVNPREEHVSIWTHMFAPIIKIFSKKQKAISKQNSTEKEPQDTSDEALEKTNQSNEQQEKENNGTANE